MIRLFNHGSQHGQYAYNIEMEVSVDGVVWNRIIPGTSTGPYYWDGPRIYCWELNYRWECRFGPLKARYLLIRNKEQQKDFLGTSESFTSLKIKVNYPPIILT